jgi:hypothetical protein
MVLRGRLLWRRASHRQGGPGPGSRARAMSPRAAKTDLPIHSQFQGTKEMAPTHLLTPCHQFNG